MRPPSNLPPTVSAPARRRFLCQAGAVCASLAASVAAMPAAASVGSRARVVRFVHTHTGETLTAPYFDGGAYDSGCLRQVDQLLRDFRNGEVHPIDPPLLDILYELQTLADRDAPFEVISGYRSPQTNSMLRRHSSGVAEHSQHLLGKAIDVRLSGYSTRRLGEFARSLERGGVGFYPASDFIHVDTGAVRYW